ncbi:hypothetical protein KSK55_04555 [Methanospirillum purgamenti]|jgi:hypothetical protein|uniref:Uncharacterized protein n=1 Tax=Methanospirillum hungatei TaxID=2203 RepID=A0A8F5VM94_METHU|nr:hypothetical protein [Methanospirillum hungatei]QXO95672.1 hypothetical protein KSK55_04555 [Methanospirillum hungatei]
MKAELSDEVLYAVYSVTRKPSFVVSRRKIEDEIHRNPYLYPCLSSATSVSRRRVIGTVMNRHFPVWGCELKSPCHVTAWSLPCEFPGVLREIEDVSC